MTKEEAIRILDPETRRETMRKIPVMEWIETDQTACRLAVEALRAQPAQLDRGRWEGCRFCGDEEVVNFLLAKKEKFCPYCGRPSQRKPGRSWRGG